MNYGLIFIFFGGENFMEHFLLFKLLLLGQNLT
jgi:hypothetical protein